MNVKRLSKRTLATLLSVLLLLSTLVMGSAATASADGDTTWSVPSGSYIFLDNVGSHFSTGKINKVQYNAFALFVTNNEVYPVKFNANVSGYTSLRYNALSSATTTLTWSDVKFMTIVSAPGTSFTNDTPVNRNAVFKGDNLDEIDTSKNNINHYSANYTGVLNDNETQKYCVIPASASDGTTISVKKLQGSGGANFAYNLQIRDNSGNALSASSLGISLSASFIKHNKLSSAPASDSLSSITSDTVVDAFYSTTVSLTATENSGVVDFVGWYDSNNEPFPDSESYQSKTISFTADNNNTITAKYLSSGFNQTANASEGGTVSVSDGTNSNTSVDVLPGTNVTFTAMPNANYKFDGWYNNAGFTGSPVSTNDPYTISSVSSDNTLYAKFSEIETEDDDEDATAPTNETAPAKRNEESRSEAATALSNQAKAYYQEEALKVDDTYKNDSNAGVYSTFTHLKSLETNDSSNSFDAIYKKSDGTYQSASGDKYKYEMQNSLFASLYNIMSKTHTHGVSYPAYGKNSLAHYWLTTDSSKDKLGDGRGVYTFFYSDVEDYNHENMQREHIWPKSKASYLMKTGLGGSDLHHLRPAYGKLNLLKLNWGFASIKNQTGWKNTKTLDWRSGNTSLWRAEDENGETFIDVKDDVRGDVARILLYIYTRWREPNLYSDIVDEEGNPDNSKLPELDSDDTKDTGERIIYDKATLLKWMKDDPVSEWEMKRNDLTQDIQGNRNVFIDYPELAWLIFDESVPSMTTPSGMANSGTDINKASQVTSPSNPVTIDIDKTDTSNGLAEITGYDLTTQKTVKNGDQVSRGDIITYTVKPDKSKIANIIEFSSDDNGTGNDKRNTIAEPNSSSQYSFTRQAGYFRGSPNTDYAKEKIRITLHSDVCVLSYKVNSQTATGGSGGSGSGMVTARYADGAKKGQMIENGDAVPNGTNVIFTFTPDYGSRFANFTNSNSISTPEPTKIGSTETYKTTATLSSFTEKTEGDKTTITYTSRTKKFTVYFAQTFNAGAADPDKNKHIFNKGMRPDEEDQWKDETDFTENFEICGVQLKEYEEDTENKALRFVSVIDKKILEKAESYGYVIGKTNSAESSEFINRNAFSLIKDSENAVTLDCTNTDNQVFGDYGKRDTTTNYKYITAAVNHIEDGLGLDTTIIARPYVVLKDEFKAENGPKIIYGQYVNFSTGENYCACSTTYNNILAMKNAETANKEEE